MISIRYQLYIYLIDLTYTPAIYVGRINELLEQVPNEENPINKPKYVDD